ncbi:MAG TPA: hypothetical protein DCZ92_08855 [Elusimicrobia bacterium]|nr:MAG: hypothetical protein A2016_01670 [Elusimicrobia bacterium GWF2_62_30]HBA60914.1 hypothetical protein [Elusimicrobiota bacterium]
MKSIILATAALSAALLLCAADRGGHDDKREGKARKKNASSQTGGSIYKMRQVTVPKPFKFESPDKVVNDKRRPVEPKRFDTGEDIKQRREKDPPREHAAIAHNADLVRGIQDEQRSETRRSHYYWHNTGGVRYAHYYDAHNIHWYGFYSGPTFYWSRYYANNWWWYDGSYSRWVFWWDGYWWWQGPGGAAFVYVDNNYYPYNMESGGVVVQKAETEDPPKSPPPLGEGKQWVSPDKSRVIQIHGNDAQAFLYDNSGAKPVYLAYLGRDIVNIRFSQDNPAQILADFKDGAFALYDLDGKPRNTPPSKPPQAAQPPAPESVPPLPTSAPGK